MLKMLSAVISVISLVVCLVSPFLYLRQTVSMESYKNILLVASLGWFVFATLWASRAGSNTR